ncbi:unnamed protein product [marine sediment metagenome]|uniref:Uncharacterized protein n=1 Tax=marine sediment metagenome TaxID=412755 RepID=X1TJ98_9ZZZZ
MSKDMILVYLLSLSVLSFLCLLTGCKEDNNSANQEASSEQNLNANQDDFHLPTFTYLREFKPNNIQKGYGADILLEDELSEQELVSFVKHLAGSHDPVLIRIFTSRIAYDQEQNDNYGPEYDSDYILFYVKNFSGSGAYRGCNEIRWMQATGKFSSKFGTKTKF